VTYLSEGGCLHAEIAKLRIAACLDGVLWSFSEPGALAGDYDLVVLAGVDGWRERLPTGLRSVDAALATAARVVSPGGWFALIVPNAWWYAGPSPQPPSRATARGRRLRVQELVKKAEGCGVQ